MSTEVQKQIDKLTARHEHLSRLVYLGRYHEDRFRRGEVIAKAAVEGLEKMLKRDPYTDRPVRYRVPLPPVMDFSFIVDGDRLPPSALAIPEVIDLYIEYVPDEVPENGPPELQLAIAMRRQGRICCRDHNGRWIFWMRSEMPPGEVHPDVGFYYRCTGKRCGDFETYDIHEEMRQIEQDVRNLSGSVHQP